MESPFHHPEFGSTVGDGATTFRLFFPGAKSVDCLIFRSFHEAEPEVRPMRQSEPDMWHLSVSEDLTDRWYQYKVTYQKEKKPETPYAEEPFADPFSRHVTVHNNYRQQAKTLIFRDDYDWEGDSFLSVQDPRDLVIYETHVKDLVAHSSSGSSGTSIYKRWLDLEQNGGIPHLKKLGVNAVEFLPLQKFPPPEPPFGETTAEGFYNTWNCYSRNYWGYMTSFFLAPETAYASGDDYGAGEVVGLSPGAGRELKDLVKLLHRNGISVIMDVVYNHTSLFDINPFCHHLEEVYLRRDESGNLMNRSGTGNEIRTEHPVVNEMITASLVYWMKEYHIDGFRFDLAGLIDESSWDKIRKSIKSINRDALVIAEPWGGRYVPWLFSNHNWSSWNDRFRNGIKGSSPHNDRGFIFSDWHQDSNRSHLENWFRGTMREYEGGLFRDSSHAVNYLESHDGFTLGDFIRISIRYDGENPVITDRKQHVVLTTEESRIARLAAFCLMITPGIPMMHAGQEFARSKLITDEDVGDSERGRMDYNSYNKDNETNWINFSDLQLNKELFHYYRGMISIRKSSPALRKTGPSFISFDYFTDPLHICFSIDGSHSGDLYDYYIAINAAKLEMTFKPPRGVWEVLADDEFASDSPVKFLSGSYRTPPVSAVLLRRLRH